MNVFETVRENGITARQAADNLTKAMQDGNNIIVFMQSEGYIRLEKGIHVTSKQLYSMGIRFTFDFLILFFVRSIYSFPILSIGA